MDSPKSSSQQSSLDSLRTVEFRQTLRGYHIDDVDEYLERVAVEAEALQEQMRQSGDRMRQATERILQLEQAMQQLEQQLAQAQAQAQAQVSSPAAAPVPAAPDDALQRTLLLAQKFVDQTEAEAEAQARSMLAEAEARARSTLADAEERARTLTEEAERHLREDVARLESVRTQLAGDVETIARHLDNERNRLRAALGEMLSWVDEHVQPAASLLAQPPAPPAPLSSGVTASTTTTTTSPSPTPTLSAGSTGNEPAARPETESRGPAGGAPPRPTPTSSAHSTGSTAPAGGRAAEADDRSPGERQGMMPLADPDGARAGVPH